MSFLTEQEKFWAGNFGDDYVRRNQGENLIVANTALFSRILSRTANIRTVIEFGANIGLNLRAIQRLLPQASLAAIEINRDAANELRQAIPNTHVMEGSILEFANHRKDPAQTWDLAFIKGVLIHINPEQLPTVYDHLHAASSRYLLVVEYYNPSPVEVPYRGHTGKLFKRDFAGEILDRFADLQLLDYGFVYRRDPVFPQDDLTWFLMEKRA
jgi:spore coat polysaccharide biosynthesis protein SpsF